MQALKFATLLILSVSLLAGCGQRLGNSSTEVGIKVQAIGTSADRSANLADSAAKEAPVVAPKMEEIKIEQKNIKINAKEILAAHDKIASANDKDLNRLKKENAELKSKSDQLYTRWIATIIIGSTLVCTVSLALFAFGYIKSLNLTVIAASVLAGGIALKFLLAYMMWIGLGVVVVIAGCVVYALWRHKQALKQTVKTVEETKPLLADEQVFKTTADGIQNKSTKSIVNSLQKTLTKEKDRESRIAEGEGTVLDRVINKFQ